VLSKFIHDHVPSMPRTRLDHCPCTPRWPPPKNDAGLWLKFSVTIELLSVRIEQRIWLRRKRALESFLAAKS
jgi:hypothetical protein